MKNIFQLLLNINKLKIINNKLSSISLKFKLIFICTCIFFTAIFSIGFTLWVTDHVKGAYASINESGRLRMKSYRLFANIKMGDYSENRVESLNRQFTNYHETLELLEYGDPKRPLMVPWTDEIHQVFEEVKNAWENIIISANQNLNNPEISRKDVDHFVKKIDRLVLLIEEESNYWLQVLHNWLWGMLCLSIAFIITTIYLGYQHILMPINALTIGIRQFKNKQFNTRVNVQREDELGELTDGFNQMSASLSQLYADLEDKVQNQTKHLLIQQQQLKALYQISTLTATATDIHEMAQQCAEPLQRIIGADAIVIRLFNAKIQKKFIIASHSNTTKSIAAMQCFTEGFCDNRFKKNKNNTWRVIPLTNLSIEQHSSCSKLPFKSFIAAPVVLQKHLLGEIDFFFEQENVKINTNTKELIEIFSAHFAIAIESLRANSLRKENAVAQERNLLAQELHDSIAQSLAFLKIQLQLFKGNHSAERKQQIFEEIELGIKECNQDVRELLQHFRIRTNIDDIEPTINNTLHKFERQTGIKTQLKVNNYGIALPHDTQLQVLHIIQESLSNIRKHANATQVNIVIQQSPNWSFKISDNGVGFGIEQVKDQGSHYGLDIMQERASRINADLEITSKINHGTCVKLSLQKTMPPNQTTNTHE